MSLLLLFRGKQVGGHSGGHTYIEHPARERARQLEKKRAAEAAKQLLEGRFRRAHEAASREQKRLMDQVQAALDKRMAIDTGRENVAQAAHGLAQSNEQQEEEAVMLLLLS